MKIFNAIFATALLGLLLWFGTSKALHSYWHTQVLDLAEQPNFVVPAGAGVNTVVAQLAARGVLQQPWLVKLSLRYFEPGLVVKAGEYKLPPHASRAQLFALLAAGVSVQYPVTVVEGVTLAEAIAALHAQRQAAGLVAGDVDDSLGGPEALVSLLSDEALALMLAARAVPAQPANAAEGWFFPDTYYVAKGDTAVAIFKRAHLKMLAVLREEWARKQADLPYSEPYDALVMASLIEKETGAVEEREAIAGVFVRRLQKGMRLQTDPTVIYGLGSEYRGNLRKKHLLADTPYNTYTRHGLPPTPIALPGRGAIRAALNPAAGDALYFVAKGDGSHHFSATFAEHLRAVRQYQILNRRSDYRSAPKTGSG